MNDTNITFDLIKWARTTPHAPALVLTDVRLSFEELDGLTWKCAQFLHDQGVRAGDVVALTFVEEMALYIALHAVARLGAAAFSLPRSSGPVERRDLAGQAGVRWLLSDRPALFDTGVPSVMLDIRQVSRDPQKIRPGLLDDQPLAPWQMISGSGSTGASKLLAVSHAQARSRFAGQVQACSIGPDDRLAGLSSLEYSISKHRCGWAMAAGATYALLGKKGADPLDLIGPLGVTFLGASVVHAEYLLRDDRPAHFAALRRARALSLAGSVVSDGLRARLRERIGDRVLIDYGSNEGGHLAVAMGPEVFETCGTVGRIVPGVELEIVDTADRPAPVGTTGLVRVRGPGVIAGYWNHGDAGSRHFRDAWFYPGDLAKMTPDGQLLYLGRADHMMIFDGINIYPTEIESVLKAHPAVLDAVAVPLRSPVHQDVPVGAVALRDEDGVSEQELLKYARERLGSRSPQRVAVLGRIPRNEAGKTVRAEIAQEICRHFGWVKP